MAALALLAVMAGPVLARRRRRSTRIEAWHVRHRRPVEVAGGTRLASLAAGSALLAERFETRRRSASHRLSALVGTLRHADPQTARATLAEAEEIAHFLAGTAGMFGEAFLANAARRAEAEIRAARRGGGEGDPKPAMDQLIAALDASAQRPDSEDRLRA